MQEILVQKEPGICDFWAIHVYPPMKREKTHFFGIWRNLARKIKQAAKLFRFWFNSGIFIRQQRILQFSLYAQPCACPHALCAWSPAPPSADAPAIGTQGRLIRRAQASPKGAA